MKEYRWEPRVYEIVHKENVKTNRRECNLGEYH